MKKASVADQIEQKIRQMKDKYKHLKNCSSENILRQDIIPKNPVNELIRQDLKNHLPLLKMQISRDVSHLQKQKSPKPLLSPFAFPTDIKKIKNIVEYQPHSFQSTGNVCVKVATNDEHERKPSDIDEQTIEFLDKIDHGHPSSRKEAENLMSWFLDMKSKYETSNDFESVVILCEQELVKHALVQCKTRGNLLKMIFSYYHNISIKNKEKSDEATNQIIQDYQNKLLKLELKLEETSEKLVNKETELTNHIKKHEEIVQSLNEDILFFKKKLSEMQKLYLNEQELWKKQWINLLKKDNKHGIVIHNDTYNLAFTRLRPDLFPPVSPESAFTESIKKKIENGEEIDLNELRKFGEDILKYHQEIESSRFCNAEVQTDSFAETQEESKDPVVDSQVNNQEIFKLPSIKEQHPISQNFNKTCQNYHKETQTEFIDELNESDLAELQLALEKEFEAFEEITEEDEDQGSEINENIESFNSDLQNSSLNEQVLSSLSKKLITGAKKGKKEEGNNEKYSPEDLKKNDSSNLSDFGISNKNKDKEKQVSEQRKNVLHVTFPKEEEQIAKEKKGKKNKAHAATPKAVVSSTPKALSQLISNISRSNVGSPVLDSQSPPNRTIGSPSQTFSEVVKNTGTGIISPKDLKERLKLASKMSENQLETHKKPANKTPKLTEIHEKDSNESSDESKTQSKHLDLTQEDHSKNLLKKNSEKHLPKKRDSYMINIHPSDRRGSVPLILSSQQGQLSQKDQPNNVKLSALNLLKTIQVKKKELQELEKQIEEKKKILNESSFSDSSSEYYSIDKPAPATVRKSTADIMGAMLKRLSLVPEASPDEKRRKSQTASFLKALLKEQLESHPLNKPTKRRSFNGSPIEEDDEEEYQEFDSKVWKNGYNSGFARGKLNGLSTGKTIGREEGITEGYAEAIKEFNEPSDESEIIPSRESENRPFSQLKFRKNIAENVKSNKELTKITEFNFSKNKQVVAKAPSHAPEILKNLLKKPKDALEKKAKVSKKMVNKIIASTYSTAISKGPVDCPEDMLEICYEEFSQRYGLKKVTDRKFTEFLASLLKTKNYRKSFMFIKLSGACKLLQFEGYSKYSVNMYLTSLSYMMNSKIGITMNFEETDDKNMAPINRAVECVKDSLEGIIDRTAIAQIISTVEAKSAPDPHRISNGLVELEMVLETICNTYENQQRSIRKGVKIVASALGFREDDWILQYYLVTAIRFISPSKFSKLESEEIVHQEIRFEDAVEMCVELNVLSEVEVLNFIKGYQKIPFENQAEIFEILLKMGNYNRTWISINQEKWKEKIENCIDSLDPNTQNAVLVWRIFESELKRIDSDYLH